MAEFVLDTNYPMPNLYSEMIYSSQMANSSQMDNSSLAYIQPIFILKCLKKSEESEIGWNSWKYY